MSYSFSGHETFTLRVSWLKKAVETVKEDPHIFRSDEAIATFGVGKNMVRSIRHWGAATGLLENHGTERYGYRVSDFGAYLAGDDGVDPFCEDPATLWLLHWHLCRVPDNCTLWHYVFGWWRSEALELATLQPALKRWLDERAADVPKPSTLKRDFQCLVNTYVAPSRRSNDLEDSLGCPLSSLGLIQEKDGFYYLQQRHQVILPPEIFAYAVLDYWKTVAPGRESLPIDELLHKNASPGQILVLGEEKAFELIEKVEALGEAPFLYQDSAGIRQLIRRRGGLNMQDLLDRYYEREASNVCIIELSI